ncbi:MAG TPA: thioredoxin [Conexivisphaerales archaeon]|nr:thioredoxin [Conexivisphaerales archaeon]
MSDDDIESLIQKRRKQWEEEKAHSGEQSIAVELTDSNFDETLKGNKLMLIDFWAPWCGPCRWVSPILEQIAKENTGKLVLGKLNTDENQATAMRFNVQGIPTIMVSQDGQIVDAVVGALPKDQLEQWLKPYLAGGK